MTATNLAEVADPRPFFDERLIAAAAELFERFATRFAYAPPPALPSAPEHPEGVSIVATVGYTARALRGSLVVLMPLDAARPLAEETVGDSSPPALCDTVGEVANMLLGRWKNRLLPHGVALAVATPMTAMGERVRVFSAGPRGPWHRFDGEGASIFVQNVLTLDPEFALVIDPVSNAPRAISEGEMLLFSLRPGAAGPSRKP